LIEQFVNESTPELRRALVPASSMPRLTRQRLLAALEEVVGGAEFLELPEFATLRARARAGAGDLEVLTACCNTALEYLDEVRSTGTVEARAVARDFDVTPNESAPQASATGDVTKQPTDVTKQPTDVSATSGVSEPAPEAPPVDRAQDALNDVAVSTIDEPVAPVSTDAVEAEVLPTDAEILPTEPEIEPAAPGLTEWTEHAPRGQGDVDKTLVEVEQGASEEPSESIVRNEPLISLVDEFDVLAELGLDTPVRADTPVDADTTASSDADVTTGPTEAPFNESEFLAHLDAIIPTESREQATEPAPQVQEIPTASSDQVPMPADDARVLADAPVTIDGRVLDEVTGAIDVPVLIDAPVAEDAPVTVDVDASVEEPVVTDATSMPDMSQGSEAPVEEGEFWGSRPLNLPQDKMENLVFVVGDLKEQGEKLASVLKDLTEIELREAAAAQLAEVAGAIRTPAEEYRLKILDQFADVLLAVAERVGILSEPVVAEVLVRARGIHHLLTQLTGGLEVAFESSWPLTTMVNRMLRLLEDRQLHRSIVGLHQGDPEKLLELDRVMEGIEPPPTPPDEGADGVEIAGAGGAAGGAASEAAPASTEAAHEPQAPGSDAKKTEQIVRIELSRIEELLGVVSQLVMSKNQICAMLREGCKPNAKRQDAGLSRSASVEIDRLTARLQAGLLQARTLPLARLFDRFPRMVRDIGRMKDKDIELTLVGQETQVDKRVMDLLADPLAHVLKLRATDGIETSAVRAAGGKAATGAMRLEADNQDSHVLIRLWDDGLELRRDVVQKTAVERGIVSAERARAMEDADLLALILHPDFPGSGSAVTATNLEQLNAQVRVLSTHARGTVFEIFFPLNVGIMSAMMARVDGEVYAIPQKTVMEVARLKPEQQFPVCKRPSMFLREQVVPLVDLTSALHGRPGAETERVAIVVQVGDQRAGLLVDEVLGQQQVVIKELDAACNHSDLFSGATLLEDGRVSLILNVIKLLRTHAARATLPQAA